MLAAIDDAAAGDQDDARRRAALADFAAGYGHVSRRRRTAGPRSIRPPRACSASSPGDRFLAVGALMALVEINFDGIVGPSHNYAGLSLGNLAATANQGNVAFPRAAALQGVAKMRHNLRLGLAQGMLLPHPRPEPGLARRARHDCAGSAANLLARRVLGLGDVGGQCGDRLARARTRRTAAATSRSPTCAPWRTAATNGRRRWPSSGSPSPTTRHFAVHAPVPGTFGDEGAANHMRLGAAPRRAGRRDLRLRRARRPLPRPPACRSLARRSPA